MGVCSSKSNNAVATICEDGSVRLIDFVNRREYYHRQFMGNGTCLDWLNLNFNHRDRFVAAGFDNGIVRILHFSKDKLILEKALKVHNNSVRSLCFSPNGECLAVLSSIGEIFFLSIEQDGPSVKIEPICLFNLQKKIRFMSWGKQTETLLLSSESGEVLEL